jgi:hypothetical protein
MRELDRENESIKQVTKSFTDEVYNHYSSYDSSYYDSGAVDAALNPSTAANPATVSAPAPQGAESSLPSEAAVNGTVARNAAPEPHSETPSGPPPAPETHSANT